MRKKRPNRHSYKSLLVDAKAWPVQQFWMSAHMAYLVSRVHGFIGEPTTYSRIGLEFGMRHDEVSKLYRRAIKSLGLKRVVRRTRMDYVGHPEDLMSRTHWTILLNDAGIYRSEAEQLIPNISHDCLRHYAEARHRGASITEAQRVAGWRRNERMDSVAIQTLKHLKFGSPMPNWRPRSDIEGVPKVLQDAHLKLYHDLKFKHAYIKSVIPAGPDERQREFASAWQTPITRATLSQMARQQIQLGFRIAKVFQQHALRGQIIEIQALPLDKQVEVVKTMKITDWKFTSIDELEIDWSTRCSHDGLDLLVKTDFLSLTPDGFKSRLVVKVQGEV